MGLRFEIHVGVLGVRQNASGCALSGNGKPSVVFSGIWQEERWRSLVVAEF